MTKSEREKRPRPASVSGGYSVGDTRWSRFLNSLKARTILYLKYRAPKYWRKRWGYHVPQSGRYEDYVENLKPVVLPKDVLGRMGERLVFEQVVTDVSHRVLACNAENYYCELDLVFLDEETKEIVFVEVKTRRYDGVEYRPETFAIDAKRKKKLALAGRLFKDGSERRGTDDSISQSVLYVSRGCVRVSRRRFRKIAR